MNIDEIGGHGGNGRRFSHELALPAQITQTIRQIITHFGQPSISPSRPVVTQPEETPAKPSGSRDILDDQQPRAGTRLRGQPLARHGVSVRLGPSRHVPMRRTVGSQENSRVNAVAPRTDLDTASGFRRALRWKSLKSSVARRRWAATASVLNSARSMFSLRLPAPVLPDKSTAPPADRGSLKKDPPKQSWRRSVSG
jgi:hypothetical protein